MSPDQFRSAAASLDALAARADAAAAELDVLVITDLGPTAWRSPAADDLRTRVRDGGSFSIVAHLRDVGQTLRTQAHGFRDEAARLQVAVDNAAQADRTTVTPSAPSEPAVAPAPVGAS